MTIGMGLVRLSVAHPRAVTVGMVVLMLVRRRKRREKREEWRTPSPVEMGNFKLPPPSEPAQSPSDSEEEEEEGHYGRTPDFVVAASSEY